MRQASIGDRLDEARLDAIELGNRIATMSDAVPDRLQKLTEMASQTAHECAKDCQAVLDELRVGADNG